MATSATVDALESDSRMYWLRNDLLALRVQTADFGRICWLSDWSTRVSRELSAVKAACPLGAAVPGDRAGLAKFMRFRWAVSLVAGESFSDLVSMNWSEALVTLKRGWAA